MRAKWLMVKFPSGWANATSGKQETKSSANKIVNVARLSRDDSPLRMMALCECFLDLIIPGPSWQSALGGDRTAGSAPVRVSGNHARRSCLQLLGQSCQRDRRDEHLLCPDAALL